MSFCHPMRQRGLTLIELMIAIVLGLFISALIVQYLIGSSRLFGMQSGTALVEANARFATTYLSQFIRQAGSRDDFGTVVPFHFQECDYFDPCTAEGALAGETDRIAVHMYPDNNRDCVGNVVSSGQPVVNVFYIDSELGKATRSLFCRGFDVDADDWLGAGLALIDGIDNLQLLYGVTDIEGNLQGYVSANNVAAFADQPLQAWDQVRAVKIGLIVSDGTGSGRDAFTAQSFSLFGQNPITFSDGLFRQAFTTSVVINNKLR